MNEYVKGFYNGNPEKEWNRLEDPYAKFEFVTTLHLIEKYFPKKGKVCDIGGGPGRYASELLKKGYDVTLIDFSKELLDVAKKHLPSSTAVICADARNLSMLPNESYDAILLLGPLYHLLEKDDRLSALAELKRLLKKGGVAIVAYLNSWGIARRGVFAFPDRYEDMDFVRAMQEEVKLPESFENFTECFWSTPKMANAEIEKSGLTVVTRAGSESFTSGMKEAIRQMAIDYPASYQNVLQSVVETCELEQYRDTTEHIVFVVKKL